MAVAFDARSEGSSASAGTSLTVSHTCTGSDRALYVAISHMAGDIDITAATATYNSVSMATLFHDAVTHGSRQTHVFRLVAPATGTNDVVVSWTGDSRVAAVCASFTGVDQTDPDDAQAVTSVSEQQSASRSVSSATGDMVMDVIVLGNGATGLAVSGTNTLIHDLLVGASSPDEPNAIGASYEAGAATVTPSWSWTGFLDAVQWAWNINAASGGGGGGAPGHGREGALASLGWSLSFGKNFRG